MVRLCFLFRTFFLLYLSHHLFNEEGRIHRKLPCKIVLQDGRKPPRRPIYTGSTNTQRRVVFWLAKIRQHSYGSSTKQLQLFASAAEMKKSHEREPSGTRLQYRNNARSVGPSGDDWSVPLARLAQHALWRGKRSNTLARHEDLPSMIHRIENSKPEK